MAFYCRTVVNMFGMKILKIYLTAVMVKLWPFVWAVCKRIILSRNWNGHIRTTHLGSLQRNYTLQELKLM